MSTSLGRLARIIRGFGILSVGWIGAFAQDAPVYVTATSGEAGIGASVSFSLSATPTTGTAVQWLKNGVPIAGATSTRLQLSNLQPRDNGLYGAALTSAAGTVFCRAAALTVPPWATVSTFVGAPGVAGSADGPLASARFSSPGGLAIDRAGNLYVPDRDNCTIRQISPAGIVTTIAGAAGIQGSADGPATAARFLFPDSVAVDASGSLYICDSGNSTIRKLTPDGIVSTLAGRAGVGGFVDGPGSAARFTKPHGVAVDSAGNVYVADAGNGVVRRITPAGQVGTVVGRTANLDIPNGVAVDSAGNLFVADTGHANIRKVTPAGDISVYTGSLVLPAGGTVAGSNVPMTGPVGLALDPAGNLFVADQNGQTLIRISAAGVATILAGRAGFNSQGDGVGPAAFFNYPRGVAVDPSGKVYVADTQNDTIRLVTQASFDLTRISTQPGDQDATPGTTIALAITPTGTAPFSYQWLKNGFVLSGATSNPLVLASAQPSDSGVYQVAVTAQGGAASSAPFTLTVGRGAQPSFALQPLNQTATLRRPVAFSAQAIGPPAPAYQWIKDGVPISGATASSYAIDAVLPTDAGSYAVNATNPAGVTASNTVVLAVNVPPTVTLAPQTQLVSISSSVTLSVVAAGTPPFFYTWRKNGSILPGATTAGLQIDAFQLSDAGSYTVSVSNAAGAVTTSAALLSSDPIAPAFTRTPFSTNAILGLPLQLSALATGVPAPTYQWYQNGTAIPGATGTVLTIPGVQVSATGAYTVTAANSAGAVTSPAAAVSVVTQVPVAITGQPIGFADLAGRDAYLAVTATGDSPFYQWLHNGIPIPGGLGASLRLNNLQAADAGLYSVMVSNASSSVTSRAVSVAVVAAPTTAQVSFAGLAAARILAADATGSVYVSSGTIVQKLTPAGEITRLPGSYSNIAGLAVDNAGNVFVSDSSARTVFKITADGQVLRLTGGSNSVSVVSPAGLAVDAAGNVYFADSGNFTIDRISPQGALTIVAGAPQQQGTTDGPGPGARFLGPAAVTFDRVGNIIVIDSTSSTVRQIDGHGNVMTLVGIGQLSGSEDGVASLARVSVPIAAATGPDGSIYFADRANSLVRRLTPDGAVVTVANVSPLGLTFGLTGIAVDPSGNVFIAGDSTLYKVAPPPGSAPTVTSQPGGGLFAAGQPLSLSVSASGTGPMTYQWLRNGVAIAGATSAAYRLQPAQTIDAGDYTVVVANNLGQTTTTGFHLAVQSDARLANLACRLISGSGADVLTAGFTLVGSGQQPILVRGIGPRLVDFGVAGALTATRVTLYAGDNALAVNAGWGSGAALGDIFASVGAFALPPGSADSALVTPLSSGAYTVQVAGVGGATGVALMELYAAGGAAGPRLANLAIRGNGGTGDSQLIGGFSIVGTQSQTLLLRAVGPSLATFGVAGALAQPRLLLSDAAGNIIASNSGWSNVPASGSSAWSERVLPARATSDLFASVGAFALPPRSDDSALVVTLPPGTYNAQVVNPGQAPGVVLLEIYELK